MISGAHVTLYSTDAEADRAFLRDVLGLAHVDAGHGWLIFALPPSEIAVHPGEGNSRQSLSLICDDLDATAAALAAHGVACTIGDTRRYGRMAEITLPGGGRLELYQPTHPRP